VHNNYSANYKAQFSSSSKIVYNPAVKQRNKKYPARNKTNKTTGTVILWLINQRGSQEDKEER
jgi:hypothetical protein